MALTKKGHVRRQPFVSPRERSEKRPALLTPLSWTSRFQNCEKINFRCLSPRSSVFCYVSPTKVILLYKSLIGKLRIVQPLSPIEEHWSQRSILFVSLMPGIIICSLGLTSVHCSSSQLLIGIQLPLDSIFSETDIGPPLFIEELSLTSENSGSNLCIRYQFDGCDQSLGNQLWVL